MSDVTSLLRDIHCGDQAACRKLFDLVYDELRKMARGIMASERRQNHTWQPTALVHEAFIRMMEGTDLNAPDNRRYFFYTAARAMRQLLIEHERSRSAEKRMGSLNRVSGEDVLDQVSGSSRPDGIGLPGSYDDHPWDSILDQIRSQYGIGFGELSDAIDQLAVEDERAATIVWLRFMGGMTMQEIGGCLAITETQADGEWRLAKRWLRNRLEGRIEE